MEAVTREVRTRTEGLEKLLKALRGEVNADQQADRLAARGGGLLPCSQLRVPSGYLNEGPESPDPEGLQQHLQPL